MINIRSDTTFHRQISWSFEAPKWDVRNTASFWNFTGMWERCSQGAFQIWERLEKS